MCADDVAGFMGVTGAWTGWPILRQEIRVRARYAVIVCPAVDDGQGRTPVAVVRRRVRCLPLQSRRAPRIVTRFFAVPQAPDDVDDKDDLEYRDQ